MIKIHRLQQSRRPVSQFLSALILVMVFIVMFLLGTFLFLTVLGLVAIAAMTLYLRIWWHHRRWIRRPSGPVTLEGEYTVKKQRDDRS